MRQARTASGRARRRGRPSSRFLLRKADTLARHAYAQLVAQAEGRTGRGGRVATLTDSEWRALANARAQERARIAAGRMKAKPWEMSNRQIAGSDLMYRILGRLISPTRVAHIANQPAWARTLWEQIAEFEWKYCGPDILAPGDERSRRIWRELVYPRLEAASLWAEGTSGTLAEAAAQAPTDKKAVEVDLWAGLVRLLLD